MTYNDFEIGEMLPALKKIVEQGDKFYLKWTCPACSERVTSNEPNMYETGGYFHQEKVDGSPCGKLYVGTKFNYLVIKQIPRKGEK